jgi:hypothetical protein
VRTILRAVTEGFAGVWRDRRELVPHAGAVALRRISGDPDQQPLRAALASQLDDALAGGELRSPLSGAMLADAFMLEVFAGLMAWARTGQDLDGLMTAVADLFLRGARGSTPGRDTRNS